MRRCRDCVTGLLWACGADYCYQERQGLIEEARWQAEQRGHKLATFVKDRDVPQWRARCTGCGQEAVIRLDPAPGQADVYGSAVRTDCTPT